MKKFKNTTGNKSLLILVFALILGSIGYYLDKKMTGKAGHGFMWIGIVAAVLSMPLTSSIFLEPKNLS